MAQNELAVVLDTPVEQLIPKLIAWNNTELLATVKEKLADYDGKVYDESTIAEAKSDRAALNRFSKALDDERKRIGAVYMAPFDKFKAEVNEVIAAVNSVSSGIDEQVKAYDAKRQEERLAEVKEYFAATIPDYLTEFISYEQIHKKEWLNATKKMAAVKKDIEDIVSKIIMEIKTIEALKSESEAELKAIYFKTLSLSEAITENERRKAERQRVEAAIKATAAVADQAKQEEPDTSIAETEKVFSISFRVTGSKEQLKALSEYLKANKIKYEKI